MIYHQKWNKMKNDGRSIVEPQPLKLFTSFTPSIILTISKSISIYILADFFIVKIHELRSFKYPLNLNLGMEI